MDLSHLNENLILHYPLCLPEKSVNLVPDVNLFTGKHLLSATRSVEDNYIKLNITSISVEDDKNKGVYDSSLTHSKGILQDGQTYTWSICLKCSKSMQITKIGFESDSKGNYYPINVNLTWRQFKKTFTYNASSSYSSFVIYTNEFRVGDILYISNFKVEEGANDFPIYSPPLDLDSTQFCIENDISGNNNNGTIELDSAPTWSNDSPRYTGCYKFNNSKILCNSIPTGSLSYSFWAKFDNDDTNYSIVFYDGINRKLFARSPSTGFGIDTNSHNTYKTIDSLNWHHYCISNNKLYIDGNEAIVKSSTNWGKGNNLSIGYRNLNSSEYPFIGELSDFRIYNIQLTLEEIQELYKLRNI